MINKINTRFRAVAFAVSGAMVGMQPALAAQGGLSPVTQVPMVRHTLQLYDGQVKVLPAEGVTRVAIGNGKIIGVKTLKSQIVLLATGTGTTDLYVWSKTNELQAYHVFVTGDDTGQSYRQVAAVLHGVPGLHIDQEGGRVVLSGSLDPTESKRVADIAKTFPGVTDMVRSDSVGMRRMVYLDVQVVDFKKNALHNLGIQWQQGIAGPAVGLVGDFVHNSTYRLGDVTQGGLQSNTLNGPAGPLQGLPLTVNPFASYLGLVSTLTSTINLAVQSGDAYILANPQLSTRSGGNATFLAGGEVPIPISSALGQTSVLYKKYGVQLDIKPEADAQGNVLASISTEVSQIDPTVTVNGYPGFLTRKTTSVVNVHSGQTIVLSGLIHSVGSSTLTKFPWISDIPILGYLFKNNNFQASRSELVIFVTPVIFNPNSVVNQEAVLRGTQLMHQFNATAGKGIYMPGFGVGPGSHLLPAGVEKADGSQPGKTPAAPGPAAPDAGKAAPAATSMAKTPPVAVQTTIPLKTQS
jgi:pilus assembly protein CpaC